MTRLGILYRDALSCKILQRAYLKALVLHQNLPRYRGHLLPAGVIQAPAASVPPCPLFTISEKSSEGGRAVRRESPKCHQSSPLPHSSSFTFYSFSVKVGCLGQREQRAQGCQQRRGGKGDGAAVRNHPKKIKLEV